MNFKDVHLLIWFSTKLSDYSATIVAEPSPHSALRKAKWS